jgi:hypothetical protein
MKTAHWEPWQALYKAALFESDRDKAAQRIAEARTALVRRARELFQAGGDNIEEEQALDDALYALHALETCLQLSGTDAAAA